MIIGFISNSLENTENLFERFLYENKETIKERSSSWARFDDDTLVVRLFDMPLRGEKYRNGNYRFDQIILAGPPNIMIMREPVIVKEIPWNIESDIPKEFRVIKAYFY